MEKKTIKVRNADYYATRFLTKEELAPLNGLLANVNAISAFHDEQEIVSDFLMDNNYKVYSIPDRETMRSKGVLWVLVYVSR